MVNVAIVGLGKMGILHGAILGALPDARVVAYCEKKKVVRHFARNALPSVKIVEDVSHGCVVRKLATARWRPARRRPRSSRTSRRG